jgi:transcriptional regulator with XRE-family HTH domain
MHMSDPVKETLGKRLYWLMSRNGITIAELSRATGLSVASLSTYITGSVEPTIGSVLLLANAFNVSVDYLLGRTRQKTVTPDIFLRFDEVPEHLINKAKAMEAGYLVPAFADIVGYVVYAKAPNHLVPLFDKEQLIKEENNL